jgi:hypothetical protein
VGEREGPAAICEGNRFRSRSLPRFPCGTKGFGIMTEYLRAGFSESRSRVGRVGAETDALESWPAGTREVGARDSHN